LLAVALGPGKFGILGSCVKPTVVLELIRQVPDISNEELKLVKKICDINPLAADDIALLEASLHSDRNEDEDEDDADVVEYTSIFINQLSR
jgi:hypothetical protein